ncbi:MAG TPA: selenium cofactor biosynthesis protein YqeC [Vicinamibacteria bacterium]|nr:selenium cofactor biosynthesis protein YqeC [Vicinamibacteria bacterium]
MALLAPLGLGRGDVVAVAGAGGKTTLLRGLAQEAVASGLRVLLTGTTHTGPEGVGALVLEAEAPDLRAAVRDALDRDGAATVLGRRVREDKLQGLDPERVAGLRDLADLVLVETDGARRRLLKAPAEHEPVVPACATSLVVVASLDALGRPLDAVAVHRLERVLEASGRPEGSAIDAFVVASALASGYPARRPPGARLLAFLNAAEGEPARAAAVAAAGRLVPPYDAVTAGSARQSEARRVPVVHGLVLAAGASTRMGRPKLPLPLGGEPLVACAVKPLLDAGLSRVVVVLGADADAVRSALPRLPEIVAVENASWRAGMASSLRAGLAACAGADAALVVLGDQPSVTAAVVARVLAAAPGRPLVVAEHGGRVVHPILLGRELFRELDALEGDVGAREVVRRHLDRAARVAGEAPRDLDTEDDYRAALEGRPPRAGEGL